MIWQVENAKPTIPKVESWNMKKKDLRNFRIDFVFWNLFSAWIPCERRHLRIATAYGVLGRVWHLVLRAGENMKKRRKNDGKTMEKP